MLFDVYLNYVQIILVFLKNNDVKYHIINCITTKAELEAVPEAEALSTGSGNAESRSAGSGSAGNGSGSRSAKNSSASTSLHTNLTSKIF
jgi:hypothetical protein